MARRVVWSRRAADDLQDIADYISKDSAGYASNEDVRDLIVYDYRIFYRLQNSDVIIAAVIHGRRDLR
jgi:plasmid stabilization system protein ParE